MDASTCTCTEFPGSPAPGLKGISGGRRNLVPLEEFAGILSAMNAKFVKTKLIQTNKQCETIQHFSGNPGCCCERKCRYGKWQHMLIHRYRTFKLQWRFSLNCAVSAFQENAKRPSREIMPLPAQKARLTPTNSRQHIKDEEAEQAAKLLFHIYVNDGWRSLCNLYSSKSLSL